MREYQTAQRKTLLLFFRRHRTERYSIDELLQKLPAEPAISRSAVYRNLDKMTKDGLLTRTQDAAGRRALYQFAPCSSCCERVHLRCERCGRVMHMEDEAAEAQLTRLLDKSGFSLDEHATVLMGVCRDCKQE